LRALSQWVGEKDFIVGGDFSLADIAAGAVLGVSLLHILVTC
jgi:glutathione S-transferase